MTASTDVHPDERGAFEDEGAAGELLTRHAGASAYEEAAAELLPLQLRAFAERLRARRANIKVLDQRAADTGVEIPASLDEVVPLLFSHQTYKSYPESFVAKEQWDRMTMWFRTLYTYDTAGVDLAGISDIDDWIARMAAAGHFMHATSGTTGKSGFLPFTALDRTRHGAFGLEATAWLISAPPRRQYPLFVMSPSVGPRKYVDAYQALAAQYGRPGAIYFLSTRPDRVSEINRLGAVRRKMADGSIRPEELQALEREAAEREQEMDASVVVFIDRLAEHLHEPVLIRAGWAQLCRIIEGLRAKGIGPGELHPDTVVWTGGGKKGVTLPDDYEHQLKTFFAGCRFVNTYGMSEVLPWLPQCAAERWHVPAQLLLILLDETGEHVRNRASGCETGRVGLFDFSLDGRWGGVITSDRVEADFSPCPCGLASTSIVSIGRFSEAGDDDKLSCAGTIEAYIKGLIDL